MEEARAYQAYLSWTVSADLQKDRQNDMDGMDERILLAINLRIPEE